MENDSRQNGGSWLGVVAPLVGFVLVVGVGLALWAGQRSEVREHARSVAQHNAATGLPSGFPSDVVPLYEGAEVTSAESGEAQSTEGEPMDSWSVVAQIDSDERKVIFDFYNDLLLERGFRQTQIISMPSHDDSGPNYAVEYGSAEMSVNIIIEKKRSDEMTQLEMKVYRLQ